MEEIEFKIVRKYQKHSKSPSNDTTEQKPRTVLQDLKNGNFSCSCCKFEFAGIPCRHILIVVLELELEKLPNSLLLPRWHRDISLPLYSTGILKSNLPFSNTNRNLDNDIYSSFSSEAIR
jgi:hypothetical protein